MYLYWNIVCMCTCTAMLYARINDDDDDDDDTLYTIEGNTDGWNWIDCIIIALSEVKQYYITTNTTLKCIYSTYAYEYL